jgi:MFS family permease
MNYEWIWKINFRILWSGQFLAMASLTVMLPLLPFYMEQLGVADVRSVQLWSGLALAAPAVSSALVSPLWGENG